MIIQDKVKDFIIQNKSDGVCFFSELNRFWYTNFHSSLGFLFVNKLGKSILLVDGRYFESAKISASVDKVVLYSDKLDIHFQNIMNELQISKLIVEKDYLSLKDYLFLQSFIASDLILPLSTSQLRIEKEDYEIECLKKAADIVSLTIKQIISENIVGISEMQLATKIDIYMRELGASANSFSTIVASGINAAFPHHTPSDKIIADGEFVILDIGCIYKNYCSDITRTIIAGNKNNANPKLLEIYNIVLEAQEKAIASAKVGVEYKVLDDVARAVIANYGYEKYFNHATGHGVGLEVHELPNVSKFSLQKITKNHVFTIEPGIYVPGLGGIRIEDTIWFNGEEPIVLTRLATKKI